ncbi:hypothetical protein QYF61_016228 [Mycteria americana]|uniref:Uncharacterized protein n=1 Tax=Mycteria americana TaxID=33587 RepID=A0AAN7MIP8_MYCAM|nr:hypothetical protein QYF61_016219 [Mycteria americana]KAK4806378.1 hypothetical protein QYF61_016228 [Mycteria americana]
MIALPKTASNHHIAHKSISVGEQEVQRGTFPRWLTHQLRHIHLLQHGVLHRLQGGYVRYLGPPWAVGGHSASPWSSPQAAGESLLRCLEHPSFFTDLGVCRVVSLTYSRSSLLAAVAQHFFPLLKYVIPEALPSPLMGSALSNGRSILELAGTGSVGHERSLWHLLTEVPLVPSSPRYQHLAMQTQYIRQDSRTRGQGNFSPGSRARMCWSLRIHVAKVSRSGVAVSQWAAESALVVSPWCQSGVQKGPQGGGSCTLEECP